MNFEINVLKFKMIFYVKYKCCFFITPHNLGLEYMIEIQHNTVKKMQNNYVCLLCDYDIKVKKDPVDTIELAKKHLTSSQHMQKYLVINLLSNKIQFITVVEKTNFFLNNLFLHSIKYAL